MATVGLRIKNKKFMIVINYKDDFGKYKQKKISTNLDERGNKKKAQELALLELEKFEKEKELIKNGEIIKLKAKEEKLKNISLSKYLDKFLYTKKDVVTPSTYYSYVSYVKRMKDYFKSKPIKDVNTEDIEKYFEYLKKEGIGKTTIKSSNLILKPTFRMAIKASVIKENPCDDLKPLKRSVFRPNYYNKEELEELLEKIKGTRYELAVMMGAYYGLRRSEVIGLKWDAIDFIKKTITVQHKVITLNNKTIKEDELKTSSSYRTLPLIPQVEEKLLEKKEQQKKDIKFFKSSYLKENKDYIMTDSQGHLLRSDNLTSRFNTFLKKNNLKHIRFHDLRHSCASLLLAQGITMKQVQEWLGHSNYATTANIYSHLDFSSKIESANAIAELFSNQLKENNNNQKQIQNNSKYSKPLTKILTSKDLKDKEQLSLNKSEEQLFKEYQNFLKWQEFQKQNIKDNDENEM